MFLETQKPLMSLLKMKENALPLRERESAANKRFESLSKNPCLIVFVSLRYSCIFYTVPLLSLCFDQVTFSSRKLRHMG